MYIYTYISNTYVNLHRYVYIYCIYVCIWVVWFSLLCSIKPTVYSHIGYRTKVISMVCLKQHIYTGALVLHGKKKTIPRAQWTHFTCPPQGPEMGDFWCEGAGASRYGPPWGPPGGNCTRFTHTVIVWNHLSWTPALRTSICRCHTGQHQQLSTPSRCCYKICIYIYMYKYIIIHIYIYIHNHIIIYIYLEPSRFIMNYALA